MVAVLLSDNTDIRETEGLFQLRKKQLDLKALVPGLPVQMKGFYNAQNQLVAESVRFKSSDLKTANDIQTGIVPQEQQIQFPKGKQRPAIRSITHAPDQTDGRPQALH